MANNSLNVYYQNARGLRTKTLNFYRNVLLSNYDIIIITETWLLDGVSDTELFDGRYIVWRRDRNYSATKQKYGGGVLVATRRDLAVAPQDSYQSSAENLWVTLMPKSTNNNLVPPLHICVVYLCAENLGNSFSQQLMNFLDSVESVLEKHIGDKFLIVGDFNMSRITWHCEGRNDCPLTPRNYTTVDEILLIEKINLLNLGQFNGISNTYGKILDLVLASDSFVSVVDSSRSSLVPVDNHHGALRLLIRTNDYVPLNRAPKPTYLYEHGDYDVINSKISGVDWEMEFHGMDLNKSVEHFYNFFYSLRDHYIPLKSIKVGHYPKWYSKSLIKAIKEKYKYLRKFNTYGNLAQQESYKVLRDRVRVLESSCYDNYIRLVENSIKDNPKYFWNYSGSRLKSQAMPSSLFFRGTTVSTGDAISNAFSDYFSSNFLDASAVRAVSCDPMDPVTCSDLSSINVDVKVITNLLSKLDPSKSAGPDHLPARFLINCAKTISVPLSILFKKSVCSGLVPTIWKRAFVTPVHKKGSKTDVTNYRPISKLCIVSKVLEKVVYSQLYPAVQQSLSTPQHGFLRGRSTVSNLVVLNTTLTKCMEGGCQVDVIYTDYSKAFDRINHDLLLAKLSRIGIRGNLLRWFASYINNRSQAVVVNNYVSSWVGIPSGVPQGSLLGPLLFVIFVNDIESCFQTSNLLCFADDMKIYAPIRSAQDAMNLQLDLLRLENYCASNHLDLNASKCIVVSFTRRKSPIHYIYMLKGEALVREAEVRDLGVYHDSKLLFDGHIDSIVNRAYRALGFVLRVSKDFKQIKTLKILYCTYVRSILEYASQVWNPMYATYSDRLEGIQRKFMRHLCYRNKERYKTENYQQLCKKYHLLPLSIRRETADLTFLLKIASGSIDCPALLSNINLRLPTRQLRFNPPLFLPLASTNYRRNSFMWRASKNFNELSKKVDIDLFNTGCESARRILSSGFFGVYRE